MKTCTKCKIEKAESEFSKQKNGSGGLSSQCKACCAARQKVYYKDNKETEAARRKAYYKDNKETVAARRKAYYKDNKETEAARRKAYREANKETVAAQYKAYREANKEAVAARQKAYYKANKETVAARRKAYREANKEAVAARQKAYYKAKAIYSKWHKGCTKNFINHTCGSNDELLIKCHYNGCGKSYQPTNKELKNRIDAINGKATGECNIYCSQECKEACPTFHQKMYPAGFKPQKEARAYSAEWRQAVLERANFECERCGSSEYLEAHHIIPVKIRPDLEADVENGVAVCQECHNHMHHTHPSCTTGGLARCKSPKDVKGATNDL